MALKIGDSAPDFSLSSTSGQVFSLSRTMAGKPCILAFYPKDFSSGCTKEMCAFREAFSELKDLDIDVLGISRDGLSTHRLFKMEYKLPFHLLSDQSGKVCGLYDALIPIVGIPKRITYLLDAQHNIAGIVNDLFDADKHIKEMLSSLR